ncbi:hemolysin family protein [Alphaproteobacteria bacterium]|nr:hemolysin family protein [Alphaproteobacteria bacterium]
MTNTVDSSSSSPSPEQSSTSRETRGFLDWFRGGGKPREESLRDTIEEYIDISEESGSDDDVITDHEKALLSNILKLRDVPVIDEMVPRAEIIAVDVNISRDELLDVLSENGVSRLPVYEDNLDNVLGSIHMKDMLTSFKDGHALDIRGNLTDIPIVSPAMPILDLIVEMRMNRRHMALVIDEHGGIDGLITLGDIIVGIVGEIDDEHDSEEPMMVCEDDGSVVADARLEITEFEAEYGSLTTNEERDEIETLGGLVFTIAGRIPRRGEILTHKASGMVFEILDADPRRVHRLRIRNIPGSLG